ncbi:cGMP-specific 3',5'-cyclic phosphodiesterase [Labeo rohita]|uniref:cGMP-specific 3',5'-cyclic phosphodiesterase n=1 Tax=Labeo rohita TaxID=84645 RepID=A0ABQ8MTC0_LABRO|nr:cGMP-specific 3',5'-cyclic phosphodiesterase [Labeo rohita]
MTRIISSSTSDALSSVFKEFSQSLVSFPSDQSAEELIHSFNDVCTNILDSVAPLQFKKSKPKTVPWLNDATRALRQTCRRAKRRWKKDKLQISYEILKSSLSQYQKANIRSAKSMYLSQLIDKNVHRPRMLFSTINAVVNPPVSNYLSETFEMCESFCHFFEEKSKTEIIVFDSSDVLNIHHLNRVKNVGVLFDSALKFDRQINLVVKSNLTIVIPYILELTVLLRLQMVQNAAARLLTGVRKHKHIGSQYALELILKCFCLFLFKCLNGLAPSYLSDLLREYHPERTLKSAYQSQN